MISYDDMAAQLDGLVRGLYERSRILFGRPPADVSVTYVVRDLAERLTNLDHCAVGPTAAREVAASLITELDSEDFWRSPLGQVVAWHIGYPQEWVPTKLVGALLGTSRQYGYQAVAVAGLPKMVNGGFMHVSRDGVLDIIRERRPVPWRER